MRVKGQGIRDKTWVDFDTLDLVLLTLSSCGGGGGWWCEEYFPCLIQVSYIELVLSCGWVWGLDNKNPHSLKVCVVLASGACKLIYIPIENHKPTKSAIFQTVIRLKLPWKFLYLFTIVGHYYTSQILQTIKLNKICFFPLEIKKQCEHQNILSEGSSIWRAYKIFSRARSKAFFSRVSSLNFTNRWTHRHLTLFRASRDWTD